MDYMQIAVITAHSSKCKRMKVGSVIVLGDNIVGTGYNGTPRKTCNDCEQDNITKKVVIHSELNAILNSLTSNLDGAILYTTSSPCLHCAALLVQKGFSRVFYLNEYRSDDGINFLNENGVLCKKYTR